MMIETLKMSTKGQVVIPLNMREEMGADEGTLFAAVNSKDTIVLKIVETPSKEDLIKSLSLIAKEGKKRLLKKGIAESDFPKIVAKSRAK